MSLQVIGLGSRVGLDLRGAGGRAGGGLQANIIIKEQNERREHRKEPDRDQFKYDCFYIILIL